MLFVCSWKIKKLGNFSFSSPRVCTKKRIGKVIFTNKYDFLTFFSEGELKVGEAVMINCNFEKGSAWSFFIFYLFVCFGWDVSCLITISYTI